MATLYDYIAGLSVGGDSVVWSNNPLTKSQIDSANGNPYIYVRELGEKPAGALYGNVDVLEQTIDVHIYQAPTQTSEVPNRDDAMGLYFDLHDAVNHVDAGIYNQPLIAIHKATSMPPKYDEDTGGVFGVVRFRLLFPRG